MHAIEPKVTPSRLTDSTLTSAKIISSPSLNTKVNSSPALKTLDNYLIEGRYPSISSPQSDLTAIQLDLIERRLSRHIVFLDEIDTNCRTLISLTDQQNPDRAKFLQALAACAST